MNAPWTVIKELAATNSRLEKEAIILREAVAGNTELFTGFKLAFSPFITFGVKKIPTHGGPDGQGMSWVPFEELASSLAKRTLTGHDARDAIELVLSACTEEQWNGWYKLILTKDMRAGFSETIVNKMVKAAKKPEYNIDLFLTMLAHDGANHEKKLAGHKLLEIKLDGIRVITIIDAASRTVTQYSRNGKVLENFSHITDALQANIDLFGRSVVLDGEMISSSFQALMKQVHRKSDVQSEDARLMLFDIMPLSEFKAGKSVMGQQRRSNLLKSMIPIFEKISTFTALTSNTMIDVVPQLAVDLDSYVGQLQFKQYNKEALERGFEGIMIKDPEASYECKRSVSWLKQKPFCEVSLTVVSVEEGTGKNVGKMGAMVMEGEDDGKFISVSVGGGYSDAQREEIWASKDSVIGQVGEVRADALTLNQDSTDVYSLRFPRFRSFRGFIAGEKI